MDKDHFIKLLQNYPQCTSEEAREMLSLQRRFPYSQVLHALGARLSKETGLPTAQEQLQLAAVYAADRAVLKQVITGDALIIEQPAVTASSSGDQTSGEATEKRHGAAPVVPPYATTSSDGLADEVLNDLQRLQQLRHNFELLFIEGQSAATTPEKVADKPAGRPMSTPPVREPGKSKKARIVEIARALQADAEAKAAVQPGAEPALDGAATRKRRFGDEIIEEIESTKEQLEPENEKQKEQIQIIDQFIRTAPSISNAKDKTLPTSNADLSTIKTGEFNDNVVSETLVDILLKQGKKDKAIEVLKKLIWKFPQKKAYFAAQIEELKN